VLYVVVDGRLIGTVAVEDEIRPESAEAVKELHDLGVRVAMITGDSHTVADSVAKRIGIDDVAAQVLPADKASAWCSHSSPSTHMLNGRQLFDKLRSRACGFAAAPKLSRNPVAASEDRNIRLFHDDQKSRRVRRPN
jgi:magnesium-transporting ATPase (P-type)